MFYFMLYVSLQPDHYCQTVISYTIQEVESRIECHNLVSMYLIFITKSWLHQVMQDWLLGTTARRRHE